MFISVWVVAQEQCVFMLSLPGQHKQLSYRALKVYICLRRPRGTVRGDFCVMIFGGCVYSTGISVKFKQSLYSTLYGHMLRGCIDCEYAIPLSTLVIIF